MKLTKKLTEVGKALNYFNNMPETQVKIMKASTKRNKQAVKDARRKHNDSRKFDTPYFFQLWDVSKK